MCSSSRPCQPISCVTLRNIYVIMQAACYKSLRSCRLLFAADLFWYSMVFLAKFGCLSSFLVSCVGNTSTSKKTFKCQTKLINNANTGASVKPRSNRSYSLVKLMGFPLYSKCLFFSPVEIDFIHLID